MKRCNLRERYYHPFSDRPASVLGGEEISFPAQNLLGTGMIAFPHCLTKAFFLKKNYD